MTGCSPPASGSTPATWWRGASSGGWPPCAGNEVTSVALADATRTLKRVPAEYFDVARVFFG